MVNHFEQRFGVGFGKPHIQRADHEVEEVVDLVVCQHAGHGVGAVGRHRRFEPGAKGVQQRHQPRFHFHESQKRLVTQLFSIRLGSIAGGLVRDEVGQGFIDGMHMGVCQLFRRHGRQVAMLEHLVVIGPVGFTGFKHDAVTVKGDDFGVGFHWSTSLVNKKHRQTHVDAFLFMENHFFGLHPHPRAVTRHWYFSWAVSARAAMPSK